LVAAVVGVIRLRPVEPPVPAQADRSAWAGIRHLRVDPVLAILLTGVIGIGLGVDPVITLGPSLAAELGHGGSLVAWMASAFGVGTIAALPMLGPIRKRVRESSLGSVGLAVLMLSMVALAASTNAVMALGSLFVGGFGMMLGITSFTTQIQQRVPDHLRGRVMSLWALCFIGSRPLAAALNGTLADRVSTEEALLTLAVILGAIALITRLKRTL
jgi:predicted MFS family arabinose efflux permease